MLQQCGKTEQHRIVMCDKPLLFEGRRARERIGKSLYIIYIHGGKVNPLALSSTLISVCMSAAEDGTQLQVLHLSSAKIYESPRQGSAAFS